MKVLSYMIFINKKDIEEMSTFYLQWKYISTIWKTTVWYQVCKSNKFYNRWFNPTSLKDCIGFWYEMMVE